MLLTNSDVRRLEQKGWTRELFAKYDSEGYIWVRNHEGVCFFFDVKEQLCKAYNDRPLGCQLYPVCFDEIDGIIVDSICPELKSISKEEKKRKGREITKLLKKIDAEAKDRVLQ